MQYDLRRDRETHTKVCRSSRRTSAKLKLDLAFSVLQLLGLERVSRAQNFPDAFMRDWIRICEERRELAEV